MARFRKFGKVRPRKLIENDVMKEITAWCYNRGCSQKKFINEGLRFALRNAESLGLERHELSDGDAAGLVKEVLVEGELAYSDIRSAVKMQVNSRQLKKVVSKMLNDGILTVISSSPAFTKNVLGISEEII